MAYAYETTESLSPVQASRMFGRALWEAMEPNLSTWRDIGQFIFPWRNEALATETGQGRATRTSRKIIDTSAGLAFRAFRAGMLAGNSSPSQRWFKITVRDNALAREEEVKSFFRELEDLTYGDLANSNWYRAASLIYGDDGLYGTAAMLELPDKDDPLRAYTFPIGSYALGQDGRGVVNSLYREFEMTAEAAADEFGFKKLCPSTQQLLNTIAGSQKLISVCHLIAPNKDNYGERASVSSKLPFKECYFEPGSGSSGYGSSEDDYLREGGYKSNPIIAPRWNAADGFTPYGIGIGLELLSDVKQFQVMTTDINAGVELSWNPAVQGPAHLQQAFVKRKPGSYTPVDIRQGAQKIERLVDMNLRLDHVAAIKLAIRQNIDEGFFKDLFKQFTGTPETLPKTAYLAQKMFQEKAGNLLPFMEQMYDEFLSPALDRAIQIRIDRNDIPNVPFSLRGMPLKFEYISPFAEAQRSMKTGGLETFLGLVAQMTPIWPEAATYIDIGKGIDEIADGYTVPGGVVRSPKEVAQIMEAQARAQQQQMQVQAAPQVAKAAKDLSQTQVGGGNALEALAGVGL